MRVVIAPLEFKGTLTAAQSAEAIRRGLAQTLPDATFDLAPMADGGPGTLDTLVSRLNAKVHTVDVRDALGRPTSARWASIGEDAALIETAEAIGLSLIPAELRDAERASSAGAGQLVRAAMHEGCRRIFVGVGGSATNDGGRGLLEELGLRFDKTGAVTTDGLDPRLGEVELIVLADVRNPLLGDHGATRTYAEQKGASADDVEGLEARIAEFADHAEDAFGVRARGDAGAGAAGGLGFALRLLGARILPGAEVVAQLIGLPERLKGADALVTGEGSFDAQTEWGKGVSYILELGRRAHLPAYGVFGEVRGSAVGFEEYISVEVQAGSLEAAVANADAEVEKAANLLGGRMRTV
jgi:glycerate 2-kinase